MVRLNEIKDSEECTVVSLFAKGIIRRRFQDIGIVEGTKIKRLHASPLDDPTAYLVRGAVIAIRSADAYLIGVETNQWDSQIPRSD